MALPKAIATSELDIGGLKMRVHVLDNGQRVIDAEDMENFFANIGNIDFTKDDADKLAKAIRG